MSTIPTPEMLRAAAQELIDRAEEMVGDGKEVTGIDVWIRLRPNSIPEVTVSKDYTTHRQIQNYLDESKRQNNDGISQGTRHDRKADSRRNESKDPNRERHHPPETDHPVD